MATGTPWPAGKVCVAKYNFIGSADHDLPFRKGDLLTILSPTRDRNWYKARRSDGREGMIPSNYVTEKSDAPPVPSSVRPSGPPPSHVTPSQPSQHSQGSPSHFIDTYDNKAVKLQKMPWFHGKLRREEAEKLLSPPKNGLFLVRESAAYRGDYTLSVCYGSKIEHYRVRKDDRAWVTVDDEEYFENLVKLVEHYQVEADGLCSRLKFSIEKSGNVDVVVSKEDFKKSGWAVQKKDIVMKSKLGKGEFGEVWLGEYKGVDVAVKMLKEMKTSQATQQFLAEASIMTTLRHRNLVGLIGVSLDENAICLVTEYMAKGALQDFLRSRGRAVITRQHLQDFSRHVATGMEYLESQNFIHRDLAARNVLISVDNIAKVADFGLAREGTTRSDSQKLPVKWTAPEALKDNKFSNKSDVWSFGILLWEIYSYGRVPYPRVPANDIMQYIEKGYRMDCPEGCPDSVYKIMKDCWEDDPEIRPNFKTILKILESQP